MTQDEYKQAQTKGEIQPAPTLADLGIAADQPAPFAIPKGTEDIEGLIYQLRHPLPTVTSVPTTAPRDATDQFRVVSTGGAYYLYFWADNAWRPLQTNKPSMQADMFTIVIPGNTNTDTAASHTFSFPPKMVIGTVRYDGGNARAWGIFMDTPTGAKNNTAPLPGYVAGSLAGGDFLGLTTGTPGSYVRALSVSGNTLNYYYANSTVDSITVDFWAIGTPAA